MGNSIGCDAKIEKPSAYNDERFRRILANSRELKGLARELSEMSHHKFGELLGNVPTTCSDKTAEEPGCWADRVLYEQDIAGATLRDAIERISMV